MVHINDLDPKVLYRILCLASGDLAENIDEWKDKLSFLQVCTKWYDLFKSYVFSQSFIGVYPLEAKTRPKVNLKNCVYYADNKIVCRSNLGIITGRDEYNCDCVSQLTVEVGFDLDISQYVHILDKLLSLGVGYWLSISLLEFRYYFTKQEKFNVPDLNKRSMEISQYIHNFWNRVPNITQLRLYTFNNIILPVAFFILIDHYAPRLQGLTFHYPIKSPLPQFSTELTLLSLDLHNYTDYNFLFYAKPLQYLKFYNISSSNFSWWMFHDFTTPGHIEFTNLKTLDLSYNEQAVGEKKLSKKYSKQARPYGSHMLQFPKLVNLTLFYPPVDCDVFFTDTIPTYLEELSIRGSCSSIAASSRLRFTIVNIIEIGVFGEEETPNNDFYIAADRYFGYIKVGSKCIASIISFIDIQRTVSWANVTYLGYSNITLIELLKILPNFPNLQTLNIKTIHLSDECLPIIQTGIEDEIQGEFKLLDTRFECLILYFAEPDDPRHLLGVLNHLLLRIATLKEVKTCRILRSSFLSEKFSCGFYFVESEFILKNSVLFKNL